MPLADLSLESRARVLVEALRGCDDARAVALAREALAAVAESEREACAAVARMNCSAEPARVVAAIRARGTSPVPAVPLPLPEWNAHRGWWHRAQTEPVPDRPGVYRYTLAEPPDPTPEQMPLCPRCGTQLRDPVLPPNGAREVMTSFPPQVWCACPGCGTKHRRFL